MAWRTNNFKGLHMQVYLCELLKDNEYYIHY